ncbi:unnamed protein product [Didymodactylos carnosus]|uniref:Calponin-homology (CH) domain-containing protein n=1 Tax=Didymodactylos carnosus TaxID=1234261 RepID=A0A814UML5_9BILA|nr:unnamed protein product [Didymodactylos carnosus]CAF1176864.1 unnamed protein product [Didymodactylos carnosus]CAF3931281.1 unnamed protein product [Didymodactylos carnosus]CAF3940897.1 unnamed protein product [Didymodactylos carnosus]
MALNREVLVKKASKRDPEIEKKTQEWIEAVTGEKFADGSYEDALRDGILLCKLMNTLQPGSIPKIHTTGGPMKLRENIGLFQEAARKYGLDGNEVFQTVDLYDKRDIPQVTLCINALGRLAQKNKFSGAQLAHN